MTTNLAFRKTAADDAMVDPTIELTVDGGESRVSIQDCRRYGGGYAVNLYAPEGEEFWVEDCGMFRSLKAAQTRALNVYRTKVAS